MTGGELAAELEPSDCCSDNKGLAALANRDPKGALRPRFHPAPPPLPRPALPPRPVRTPVDGVTTNVPTFRAGQGAEAAPWPCWGGVVREKGTPPFNDEAAGVSTATGTGEGRICCTVVGCSFNGGGSTVIVAE